MSNTNLLPDLNQAQTMLKALAPHDGAFTFQTFADGGDKNKALIKQFNGSFKQHASQLTQLNQQGAGVFVTINQTDLQGRKAENITAVRAVFVDFDNSRADRLNDLLSLDRLYDGALLPSFIVETSTGKHHAYWLADGIPLGEFKPYQETLIYFFSGLFDGDNVDKAIHDLPRIMRMAGFYHNKDEPVLSKIVYPNGGQDIQRYSYEQIKAMIDSLPAPLEQANLLQTNSNAHTSKVILPQTPANSQTLPQLTAEKVRTLSRGRWETILGRLGYAVSTNPKEPTQCPVCGGKDRFRFDNQQGTGSYICSQGTGENSAGDGLSLLIDHAGMTPQQAIASVTGVLNEMGLITPYDSKHSLQPIEWGEIKQPNNDPVTPAMPYPIHAWDNCELAKQALLTLSYYLKLPTAMPAQSILAVLSHIAQQFVDAPMPNGHNPCSIFVLTQADSGDGKSQCAKWAGMGIEQHEKELERQANEKIKAWHDEIATRQPDQRAIALYKDTHPKPPKHIRAKIGNGTLEGIKDRMLVQGVKNIFYSTSEAGIFFGGFSMNEQNTNKTISEFADMWSDGSFDRVLSQGGKADNKETNSYVDGVRITLDLGGQPIMLEPVLNNEKLNKQGFLIRFLYAFPYIDPQTRKLTGNEIDLNQNKILKAFWSRCRYLLSGHGLPHILVNADEQGKPTRHPMPFSDDGKRAFIDYWNESIDNYSEGGKYEKYKEIAKRLAENASRIATVMAFFDGRTEITKQDIENAKLLTEYSINERIRYSHNPQIGDDDSQKLLDWIVHKAKTANTDTLGYAFVQSKVNPKAFRDKNYFPLLITVLADEKQLQVIEEPPKGNGKPKRMIKLNPALLSK